MAQVRIDVTWDPSSKQVSVSPDPAYVYWGRKDTAKWVLAKDGGDKKAKITAITFASGGGKGCFGKLHPEAGSGEKKWDGDELDHTNGRYKYAVTVTGESSSCTLDPDVINGEKP
jgi:hypothetical protein